MEGASIESLYRTSDRLVHAVSMNFHRYLYDKIRWNARLIAIKGARGVGKTTLLLQHIKENFGENSQLALYVSLDNMWFATHTLSEVVEYHYTHGGTHLFIDEVHKYKDWQTVIKNINDEYPDMHVVYTSSSMLKMESEKGDLSRRQILYQLNGLSFREYMAFEGAVATECVSLQDLLRRHTKIALQITSQCKVLPLFERYLKVGFYPFYKRDSEEFEQRLQSVIRTILYEDLPAVEDVSYPTVQKVQRMLMILAAKVPQTPNMSELYGHLETNREQGMKMLDLLEKGSLLNLLSSEKKSFRYLSKPDKIYLNNTNLMYALTPMANVGTLRETFFLNQLMAVAKVCYPPQGDFFVDNKYLFEVGGGSKSFEQIKDLQDSYLAVAGIEIGYGHRIPLWMFGLLY